MDRGKRRRTAKERTERKERENNSGKGNGGWWNEQREQVWTEPFRGYSGQGRRQVERGTVVSHPSQSVASDPGSSASHHVHAVKSSPVPPACWSAAASDVDEDWPAEWCYDCESDWIEDWHEDWSWPIPEKYTSEWHDDEGSYLVCESAACCVNFAKDYTTDDSERSEAVEHPGSEN